MELWPVRTFFAVVATNGDVYKVVDSRRIWPNGQIPKLELIE